ncbi:hybrid sensor histidine kinase/response regulator [Halorussus marinus]|uniref:hybrid sensor histidine kinase/response regulator n=1 Tax=Halorussus marinus TaxID=2505976 RepID=UPI0010931FD1|nr:response regulator [Halorussus marinus]
MSEFTSSPGERDTDGAEPSAQDDPIAILVVDDDEDLAELTATYLERARDDFDVGTETGVAPALDRLEDDRIDCVVSDYDMPGMDGLTFLDAVRDRYPDLPFVLFTGKGNEEIASEAISAGVTDYLQKGSDTGQYSVLANRIANAVEQYRAKRAVEHTRKRFDKLVHNSTDVISIISADARFEYLSPSAERILGYDPEEMVGEYIFDYAHPEDRQQAMERFFESVQDPDQRPVVQFRFKHPDGSWPVLESRGRNLLDDPHIEGFVVNSRDITERKRREEELQRHNEQLEEITSVISHDLRNPLNVAQGSLDMARETGDDDHFDRIDRSLRRIDEIIDDVLTLARQSRDDPETEAVSLTSVAESAWEMVDTGDADLRIEESAGLEADESRTQQLLENLFSNAIEHAADDGDVTVRVGLLDAGTGRCDDAPAPVGRGFYVADDGRGIPADDREAVFESGYSTGESGTGFGLAIVKQIAAAHGWDISLTDSTDGGARFEFSGVEPADE